jgi:hypothetical protein
MLVLIAHDLQDLGEALEEEIHVYISWQARKHPTRKSCILTARRMESQKDPMKACACTAMELQL